MASQWCGESFLLEVPTRLRFVELHRKNSVFAVDRRSLSQTAHRVIVVNRRFVVTNRDDLCSQSLYDWICSDWIVRFLLASPRTRPRLRQPSAASAARLSRRQAALRAFIGLPGRPVGSQTGGSRTNWVDRLVLGISPKPGEPQPRPLALRFRQTQGWMTEDMSEAVYALLQNGHPVVFSSRCTHLGCAVHWESSVSRFQCPCHGGAYDPDGKVVAGPPPLPLRRLDAELRDSKVWIRRT